VSLYCFAAALPLTAAGVVLDEIPEVPEIRIPFPGFLFPIKPPLVIVIIRGRARLRTIETTLGLLGLLLSFAGMGAIFWHFAWGAAVLFVSVSTPVLVYVASLLLIYAMYDEEGRSPQG
jgi:hypothetical protein